MLNIITDNILECRQHYITRTNLISFIFEKFAIEYNIVHVNNIKKNSKYFCIVEPLGIPDENLLNDVHEKILDLIKQKKVTLIVAFAHEGFSFAVNHWVKNLYNLFKSYGITAAKKILIYGNIYATDIYNSYIKEHNLGKVFDKVFGIDLFQHLYRSEFIEQKTSFVDINKLIFKKDKDFLNFNASIRSNRILLVSELKRRNLEQNGFVSFLGRYYNKKDFENIVNDSETIILKSGTIDQLNYLKFYATKWQPQILDMTLCDLQKNDRAFDVSYYENTYYSLISETLTNPGMFVTEKIFKPIAIGHPFIVFGCKGTLKYLKCQGYKTFSDLFDESYDDIDDELIRLNMILDEIEKFANRSNIEKQRIIKNILPIVKHNRYHFFNNKNNKRQVKKIFEIIKQI